VDEDQGEGLWHYPGSMGRAFSPSGSSALSIPGALPRAGMLRAFSPESIAGPPVHPSPQCDQSSHCLVGEGPGGRRMPRVSRELLRSSNRIPAGRTPKTRDVRRRFRVDGRVSLATRERCVSGPLDEPTQRIELVEPPPVGIGEIQVGGDPARLGEPQPPLHRCDVAGSGGDPDCGLERAPQDLLGIPRREGDPSGVGVPVCRELGQGPAKADPVRTPCASSHRYFRTWKVILPGPSSHGRPQLTAADPTLSADPMLSLANYFSGGSQ